MDARDGEERDGEAREDAIAEIVGTWKRERDQGSGPSPGEVIERHPELAAELADAFAMLRELDDGDAPGDDTGALWTGSAGLPHVAHAPLVDRIGDFRIVREIGRGGMGVVYEAEQMAMRRPVALKVLYPSVTTGPQAIARFRREAQATGRLHHTNIVQVHAMGEDAGQWYYAMELVRGRALSEILGDLRRLRGDTPHSDPPTGSSLALSTTGGSRAEYARIAGMFAGLADALATAHEGGVVHRDVKPSNVMLDETGRLKILDFGLAAIRHEAGDVTAPGDVLGTPAYMSPEQARGRPVSSLSDVYSLGATLYEVLTLRPPVRGRDFADTVRRVLTTEPAAPRRLERRIPRDLETIVLKALEKEPARRYASAADLARDLRAFADDHAIAARRVGLLGRAWRQVRRHPDRAVFALAVVVALGCAAWFASIASQTGRDLKVEEARRLDREYRDFISRALVEGRDVGEGARSSFDLFLQAIAMAPERHEAYFLRAIHQDRREGIGNLADLDAARARGLPEAHYRLSRVLVLHEHKNHVEASAEAAMFVAGPTPDIEVLTLQAAIAAALQQDADAERLFDQVIGVAPRGSHVLLRAYGGRSDVRTRRGNFAGAIEDRMAERAQFTPDLLMPLSDVKIAWLWRRLGDETVAEQHVERALSAYGATASGWAYTDFSWLAYRLGEVAWARRAVEAGLEKWPKHQRLRAERLRWLPPAERIQEADRLLAEWPTSGPGVAKERAFLIIGKAGALEEQGSLEEALTVLDEGTQHPDVKSYTRGHRAILLRRLGRFQEAEIEYRAELTTPPWPAAAVVSYAHFLLHQRRPREAKELLERALETDRSQVMVLDTLSQVYQSLGNWDAATAAARKALALAGDGTASGDDLLLKFPLSSLAALVNTHPAEVVERLEGLCRTAPREVRFRVYLAGALGRLGEVQEAWDVLERPPPMEADFDVMRVRASVLMALGRFADAARTADAMIQMHPDAPDGYYSRLTAQVRMGSTQGVIPLAQQFLDRVAQQRAPSVSQKGEARTGPSVGVFSDEQLSWARYYIAIAYRDGGDPDRALEEIDKALGLGPSGGDARYFLVLERAHTLAKVHRHDEAAKAIEEAARLRPEDPRVALYRANIACMAGDFLGHERWIREAIRLSGTGGAPAGWYLQHINALVQLGRLQEAFAEADASFARGNAEAATWAALARSLDPQRDATQLQRAREIAEQSVSGPDPSSSALRAKGAVHVAAGEWRGALAALEASAARRPPGADFLTSILLLRAQCRLGIVKDPTASLAAFRTDPEWRSEASPLFLRLAEELAQESRGWRAQRRPGPLLPDSVAPEASPQR